MEKAKQVRDLRLASFTRCF